MNKFHSTVSRREFMKGLGLAGAGLGAAAAAAPVYHDLDEVTASPLATWKRAWWVKQLEHENPTTEIDWNMMKPSDQVERMYKMDPTDPMGNKTLYGYRSTIYGTDAGGAEKDQMILDAGRKWNPDWQGDTLRDLALSSAVSYGRVRGEPFAGKQSVRTPERRGLPKWTGTPEENLRLITTAFRFFGVSDVGVVELTPNTRKLVFIRNRGGTPWRYQVFEDIPEAYEEVTERGTIAHIPNKAKWMISWTTLQPYHATKRYGTLSGASASRAYQQISVQEGQMQDFLRGLGYQGLQGGTGAIGPANAWGVLSGVGEMTRMYHVVISPEFGGGIRGNNRMITDLPLSPTPPIDAGIRKFCYTCMKCSEACPSDSLSFDRDPTWEHPTAPRNPGITALQAHASMSGDYANWPWNLTGIRAWWLDVPTCVMCRNCMGACTFTKLTDAPIHQFVQGTVALAGGIPGMNSFLKTMDDFMGYGLEDPDGFWDLNLPTYGIDTTRGAKPY